MIRYAGWVLGWSIAICALMFGTSYIKDAWPAIPPVVVGESAVRVVVPGGVGSGVHIGSGLVVTATHVVKGEPEVHVRTQDGRQLPARIVWSDAENDVTLLIVDNLSVSYSRLDCRPARVGEQIEAVGNPSGMDFVHSWGRVASTIKKRGPWLDAYVADLTVGPGVSGGPVYGNNGRVLGIVVGLALIPLDPFPSASGYSYIVPSSTVCKLLSLA